MLLFSMPSLVMASSGFTSQNLIDFRTKKSIEVALRLKGFATFWEFSFYGQKKVADYEYHSLFAEKIHFHT